MYEVEDNLPWFSYLEARNRSSFEGLGVWVLEGPQLRGPRHPGAGPSLFDPAEAIVRSHGPPRPDGVAVYLGFPEATGCGPYPFKQTRRVRRLPKVVIKC